MEKQRQELNKLITSLYEGEKKILVHGDGRLDAQVVLVGEAPGQQETLLGKPFVGKAGKNLDEFLALTGIDRSALYVTNVVKFRPTRISDAGRIVNRAPTQEEIQLFLPFLKKELETIHPKCVVTLGNVPLKALVDRKLVIGDVHGTFIKVDDLLVYPMYHPASLIYNRALRPTYEADLRRFSQWLGTN